MSAPATNTAKSPPQSPTPPPPSEDREAKEPNARTAARPSVAQGSPNVQDVPKRGRPKKQLTPEELQAKKERKRQRDRERYHQKKREKAMASQGVGPNFGHPNPPPPPPPPAPPRQPDSIHEPGEPDAPADPSTATANPFDALSPRTVSEMCVNCVDAVALVAGNRFIGEGAGPMMQADKDEREALVDAGEMYLKSQNMDLPPGQILLFTVAMIYLPKAVTVMGAANRE